MEAGSGTAVVKRPYDILLELEQTILGTRELARREEGLWVGVAFKLGGAFFVASRNELREVIPWSGVTRVPRAKPWLLGLANVRGQLIPITDLKGWLGAGQSELGRTSRVIIVNHPDVPAGLLVDQVIGFRRYSARDVSAITPGISESLSPFLLGAYARGGEHWNVLALRDLVESESFLQAAS